MKRQSMPVVWCCVIEITALIRISQPSFVMLNLPAYDLAEQQNGTSEFLKMRQGATVKH